MPKAITMTKIEGKPGKVYYPLALTTVPQPTPGPNDLIISIRAAALNHRDHFLRQHLYPSPSFTTPLLADGTGVVTATGSSPTATRWLHKTVLLTPGRGWASSPHGPESPTGYAILGGTSTCPVGTLQEVVCVDADEVEEAPSHLAPAEAAALPLTGLTAWRALVSKSGHAEPGANVLVTGIGGGVALMALQFGVARGCRVWVTSGSAEKITKAKALGAQGGVSYKSEGWEKELKGLLPKERPFFDTVIDGAGGDIMKRVLRLLKPGGIVVQYGMTTSPKMDWSMPAVLLNLELRGSTMGSRQEFRDMVAFVASHRIVPVVSRVVHGLDNLQGIEGLFEDIKAGRQFGKLVVELGGEEDGKGEGASSKL